MSRTPKCNFATEHLGGTPVILWVRCYGIMKSPTDLTGMKHRYISIGVSEWVFYNVMMSRTPKCNFATEHLGGTPVILWVRCYGIMKSPTDLTGMKHRYISIGVSEWVFYNVMMSRTPKCNFATEHLGGTPVILWVRCYGIMKSPTNLAGIKHMYISMCKWVGLL